MIDTFEITFLGTNGSCAYNGGNREKYGTNTPCVAVSVGGETLLFDSGTGICGFNKLAAYQQEHLHLFYSHTHIDHFSGLLFFSELFNPKSCIDIYGNSDDGKDFYSVVDDFLKPPLHPVGLSNFGAKLRINTIAPNSVIELKNGVVVRTFALSHPGGSMGYRVEYRGNAFCYCTDIELENHHDDAFIDFIRDTDLLILDAFFDDGKVVPQWGHSSWKQCAEVAKKAQAKQLALFHYGFGLCDEDIDIYEQKAQAIFPNTIASCDGMKLEICSRLT